MNDAILESIGDLQALLAELTDAIAGHEAPPMQLARLLIELDRNRAQLSRVIAPVVESIRWSAEHPEAVRER